jgi:DNA-binding CsgD family transcriptional regulator/N-acetylneuraminic acid mutarotase
MYNFHVPTLEGSELSERELGILRLVATGASNKEIAQQLFISPNTVKVHLRNIFTKIGVLSRTEAAMYAVHMGLVQGSNASVGQTAILSDEKSADRLRENPNVFINSLPVSIQEPTALSSTGQSNRLSSKTRLWLALGLLLLLLSLTGFGLAWLSRNNPLSTPTQAAQPTALPALVIPTPTSQPRWQVLPGLSTPRSGLAVAAYDGMLYAIGGETTQGVSGLLEAYDPVTQAWKKHPAKPLPAADIQAAVLGGKIYVPGGRLGDGKPSNTLEIYDFLSESWERGPDLPYPVSGYALAVFEGRLFLFGGWDGAQALQAVIEYDPALAAWRERTPMPTARAFSSAAVAGGKIYVVGGFDGKSALTACEAYNPSLDDGVAKPWSVAPPLPDGRWGMGAAGIVDTLLIIGGVSAQPGTPIQEEVPAAYQFFPSQDTWTAIEQPGEQPWTGLGVASLEQYVYAVGGKLGGEITAQVQAYQAVYTVLIPIVR